MFRALFLLYAESAGHLPMRRHTYAERSLTAICRRAADELGRADPRSTSLWRDTGGLIEAMRNGQTAWGVPPYNGDLFALDGFAGARTLSPPPSPTLSSGPALVRSPATRIRRSRDFSASRSAPGHIYGLPPAAGLRRDDAYDPPADRYSPQVPDEGGSRPATAVAHQRGGRKSGRRLLHPHLCPAPCSRPGGRPPSNATSRSPRAR